MAVQDRVEYAHILDQIESALTDENSSLYLKNIKSYPVTKHGFVLLDPLNEEDREWFKDGEEA